ncbi:MAG: hypothetical protein RL357_1845 [Pseudomonadota bacterium]|jgi:stringent starvation protein B
MEISFAPSMRAYFMRALHEWCHDQSMTPYMLVSVNETCEVPLAYVQNGQIVLNVSHEATQGFVIGDEYVQFKGRFAGRAQDVFVPLGRVLAVYSKETGQGMVFPIEEHPTAAPETAASSSPEPDDRPPNGGKPFLRRVK